MKKGKFLLSFSLTVILSAFSLGMASADSATPVPEVNASSTITAPIPDVNSTTVIENDSLSPSLTDLVPFSIPGETYKGTNVAIQAGDILVTNSTGSSGFGYTGHAGILIDNGTIVSIEGYNKPLIRQPITDWYTKYANTKVLRYTSSPTKAQQAATWASNYQSLYKDQVHYGLINNIFDYYTETYCSKIVWDAYYYGASVSFGNPGAGNILFLPYSLPDQSSLTRVAIIGSNF
ncbi:MULTISPECIES: YiiX/YebB-like N1pC/P60 family cysteine hydrolase [Paenibacillus]|uniref:YiiX/YebB-like N1pC/P60 family cysteine hydrolase n=1 Tax=Paenibacillus TaxID=44249 RepID=UPI0009F8FA6B|nr:MULTISPECIES: YiiX/YebB-like N1pC/P60 family cysteine hydrolase [Paenibacillus]